MHITKYTKLHIHIPKYTKLRHEEAVIYNFNWEHEKERNKLLV